MSSLSAEQPLESLWATPHTLHGFFGTMDHKIGARDMSFPRLNAFSHRVFLFSGLFLYLWFSYVPLTLRAYSPGGRRPRVKEIHRP